jgi:glycogen synthase
MKVLMFGWEFPPHLSGGLGTACYGLTKALVEEDVHVFFVVPKVYGDEPNTAIELINASDVGINETTQTQKQTVVLNEINQLQESLKKTHIETIQVPINLTPYNSPDVQQATYDIQRWNYEFSVKTSVDKKEIEKLLTHVDIKPYAFAGGYGKKLSEEVFRYADVASVVALRQNFDVIHAHDWMTFPAGIAAKRMSGKPLVVHVHATECDRAGDHVNEFVFDIEKKGMEAADRVVAVSQWTKDIIIQRYRIPGEKIDVVHNGVIQDDSRVEFSEPPIGAQVVTFLGRVTHQKGPQYFVNAARDVISEFPNAHFIIAGSGDMLPQVIQRVAQLKLSSHFHFTGFLKKNEIDKVLSYTNVYVMPSVSEPFGITPLEAMHAGVPVIISNQSGVAEVISNTIKVDFWDTFTLAHVICSILRYKSLSKTMGENGRQELKEITWQKSAKKLKKLYHEITK